MGTRDKPHRPARPGAQAADPTIEDGSALDPSAAAAGADALPTVPSMPAAKLGAAQDPTGPATTARSMPAVTSLPDGDDDGAVWTQRLREPSTLAEEAPQGRYVVVDEFARGGLGRLLRARDMRLGRTVAIKQLQRKGPDAEARFLREALITARLQHPSIVPIYDAGRLPGGEAFYAMKLVSGRSLEELIAETTSLDERLGLLPRLIAVAEAVAYAHSRGIIHRDLKPANVIIGEFGETIVIDWGLAKPVALADLADPADARGEDGREEAAARPGQTQEGTVKGTPAYMPPEQARGARVDERADVYALGALIYQTLSGRPPYEGQGSREVIFKVLSGPPTPLSQAVPGVPRDLESIVAKAMARDPEQRYAAGKELVEDLRRFQTGQLVRSHHYSLRERVSRFVQRNRLLLSVAAVALVTLVVGLLLMVSEIAVVRNRTSELAQKQRTVSQVQTAIRHLLREVQVARDAVVQLAADPQLVSALSDPARTVMLGDVLGDRLRRLPSSRIEIFGPTGQHVLSRLAGYEADAQRLPATDRRDPVLARALGYERVVELSRSRTGRTLLARIAAPIVDADYILRGVVLLAMPLDGKLASRLTRTLAGAEVILHAGTGLGYASFLYAAGIESPEFPAPRVSILESRLGPPGGVHYIPHRIIAGRDYSLGYAALRDPEGRPLGLIGVALPQDPTLRVSWRSGSLVLPVLATVLVLSLLVIWRGARSGRSGRGGVGSGSFSSFSSFSGGGFGGSGASGGFGSGGSRSGGSRSTLALVLALAAGLAGQPACSRGRTADPSLRDPGQATGTLHVVMASDALDFNGLDPALVSTADSVDVGSQIFERLVKLTPDGKDVAPLLATHWTLAPNGTEWTFYLRRGVRFHDGTPFDAQAVVFSFTRKRNWMGETLLGIIKKVEAIDPATVRIVTARPYAPFLSNLATYSASIVSPAAVKKHGKSFTRNAVGTGPFRLAAWEPGKRIVLQRNAGYWGRPPRLSRLVFRVLRDPRERLDALETGAADVGAGFRPEDLPIVALHPQLRIHRVLGHNVVYVALNTTRPPFDDVVVRRAANYAINKAAIVHLFYGGFGRVAHGPVPPIIWSHHAQVPTYAFDVARARQMLAPLLAARLPPGQKLKFYALRKPRPYLPDPIEIARMLQRNLAAVGLESELLFREYKDFVSEVHRGNHHLCLTGWIGDNTDPDNFLYTLLHSENAMSGAAANRALYKNPEYDALITRAQQSSNRAVREAAYRRAQELVARDAPWIPILHADGVVITRRRVGGTETGMRAWTHTDYGQLYLIDEGEGTR